MKKTYFLSALVIFAGALVYGAVSSGQLEDVVVKTSDTVKIESDKAATKINVDHMKAINPSLETDKAFLEKLTNGVNKMKMTNPDVLTTEATVSPWLSYIAKEPFAEFQLNYEKIKVKSWEFVITDSRGYKFRMFSGKNSIPAEIKFTGRNEDGSFMRVGNIYGYILTYLDEAGAKKTVIGQPFSVDGALHQEKEGLIVSIAAKAIFDPANSSSVTKQGKLILTEAADILKEHFNIPVVVKAYAETDSLGEEQAGEMVKYFAKILVVPENKIAVKGFRDIPENYHIDIVISNKKEGK